VSNAWDGQQNMLCDHVDTLENKCSQGAFISMKDDSCSYVKFFADETDSTSIQTLIEKQENTESRFATTEQVCETATHFGVASEGLNVLDSFTQNDDIDVLSNISEIDDLLELEPKNEEDLQTQQNEINDEKKLKRAIKNRISARESRKRKRDYEEYLKNRIAELEQNEIALKVQWKEKETEWQNLLQQKDKELNALKHQKAASRN